MNQPEPVLEQGQPVVSAEEINNKSRDREKYNAYMRQYMAEYRKKKKVGSRPAD